MNESDLADKIHELRASIGRILSMAVTVGYDAGHSGIEAECRKALEIASEEPSCIHPAEHLFYHGAITGNLSDYRCNLCQKVMNLPVRAQRTAIQPTSDRDPKETQS